MPPDQSALYNVEEIRTSIVLGEKYDMWESRQRNFAPRCRKNALGDSSNAADNRTNGRLST